MVRVKIKRLEWDEYNILHIAHHQVKPKEIEEVIRTDVVRLQSKSHSERVIIIGKTNGGRSLKIVLKPKAFGVWRAITAHDASRKERKFYQEK